MVEVDKTPAAEGAEQKELLGLPAPGTYRGAPDAGEDGKRTLDMSSGEAKVEVRARSKTWPGGWSQVVPLPVRWRRFGSMARMPDDLPDI